MPPNINILFLIGVPNSGKTTQAAEFAKSYHKPVYTISPGTWLRNLSKEKDNSDLGSFIFYNWSHESLTPLVTDFIDKTISGIIDNPPHNNLSIIIDGFPRNRLEAESLPSLCKGYPFLVVELLLHESETIMRGKKRQRGDDDTPVVTDIRNESYLANIERIKDVLDRIESPIVEMNCSETTPEEVCDGLIDLFMKYAGRLPIPSVAPRRTLARKMFIEASPIESAVIIQKTLKIARSSRLRKQFFGTHPISLTRVNLPRVRSYPYLVALKATGVRYMCYIDNGCIWLLTRKLEVFVSNKIEGIEQFNETLLDGELIGEEEAAYYIVLDCIASNGENCMRKNIIERLRNSLALGNFMCKGPLFFRQQEYVDRSQLSSLLQRRKHLPWEIDGIILQPARLPYRLGIDYNMFKWKPLGDNTADFYYNDANSGLYCRVSGRGEARDGAPCPINTESADKINANGIPMVQFGRLLNYLKPKWLRHGMIIECAALPEHVLDAVDDLRIEIEAQDWKEHEIVWVPQHHRADKPSGNVDWVAQSVVQSIIDNITQEELERLCIASNIHSTQLPYETAKLIPHSTRRSF